VTAPSKRILELRTRAASAVRITALVETPISVGAFSFGFKTINLIAMILERKSEIKRKHVLS
jgi:hypothetical protein